MIKIVHIFSENQKCAQQKFIVYAFFFFSSIVFLKIIEFSSNFAYNRDCTHPQLHTTGATIKESRFSPMTDTLVQGLTAFLGGKVSKEAIIFIISMIPILELRGGLLAASPALLDVPILKAIPICILGNLLPIPFILLLIEQVLIWMEQIPGLGRIALWLRQKADKNKGQVERYGFWGLVLFVGIPLPGTGAWTGSLVAALLHMRFRKAFAAILLGIAIATIIMSLLSYGLLGVLFG